MFSWILIAFVIALIFGVIKVEQLKTWSQTALTKVRELYNEFQNRLNDKNDNN